VKAQVQAVLDAGDLQVWVEQEINGLLEDALNTRLKEERDEFLAAGLPRLVHPKGLPQWVRKWFAGAFWAV